MKDLKRFLSIFFLLGIASWAVSQNVTLYIVDVDDTDFSNVKRYVYSRQTINTKFSTIVDVRREGNSIGKVGNWEDKELTKSDLKKMISNVLMMNALKFDQVLGLNWGMKLEQAVSKLKGIGLKSWSDVDDGIMCIHKTGWDGIVYDVVKLCYFISNKQNKFLSEISFLKMCNNIKEAKSVRESIAVTLRLKYGSEALETDIGENGFKSYTVYGENQLGRMSRINLYIGKAGQSSYGVVLRYNGILEASKAVEKDNRAPYN